MSNIAILLLSDIHLNISKDAENQGLVISEFFKDLPGVLEDTPYDDRFCIISGDLVQRGGIIQSYEEFCNRFLKPLTGFVPLKNTYCIPGNHDLNRGYVESHRNDYEKWLNWEGDESTFNGAIGNENEVYFTKAFDNYISFRDTYLISKGQSILGYSVNLVPEVSVMLLNSAILSNGGLDKDVTIIPSFPKDKTNLKIATSELFEWSENNDGRTKILVMHHPKSDLTEYAQRQLDAILKKSVDVFINGHTHFQKYESIHCKGRTIHTMTSPQLYSNKADETNGYSLLLFEDRNLSSIEYRQWSPKNHHFMVGAELADDDSGKINVELPKKHQKVCGELLKNKLEETLLVFDFNMPWCHRLLSTSISSSTGINETTIDYLSILNSQDDFQIVAPPQFGLTTFARYLAYKAEDVKNEKWVYLNLTPDCTHSNIENKLRFASTEVGFDFKGLNAVIIDNWNGQLKDRQKIIDKIKKMINGIRVVLMSNIADTEVLAGIDTEESHRGFKLFYLRELSRSFVRVLVDAFNSLYRITDTDLLLERLLIDIEGLNEHRTPLNCIQLLMAYRSNFESHPVNRSRVLELVLDTIFKNSNTLYYNDVLNEKDCCNIMSVIAYELFKKDTDYFTWEEFNNCVEEALPLQYTESQRKDLLSTLASNQVLECSDNSYRFHFVYWVYYFVAYRMYASNDCFEKMMVEGTHFYNADIVEFYTAIDDKSDKLVSIIVNKLDELVKHVNEKVGRPFWNPYESLKWNQNETTKGKTTVQIESEIVASRLPDDLKDSVKDRDYDAVRPYNQPIRRVFDEYRVSNMMNLARSASRALRNCYLVDSKLMVMMRNAIYTAWVELFKVLILITPALAKTGYGGFGGANFKLEGNFSDQFEECIKQIICAIPFNIINWYKEDFFSEKRVAMYFDAMQNDDNPVIRHLNARLIAECRPKNWRDMINSYIASVGRNTYYLYDIDNALRHCYSIEPMSDEDLRLTRNLILTCYTKHKDGGTLPSLQDSNKNAGKASLPKRLPE